MVVNCVGRVMFWNQALEDLPGFQELGEKQLACCDLLGCRRAGGPLEDGCITQLVIETGERSAEIELAPTDRQGRRVWLRAAPVYQDCSRIVMQIRPGRWQHDRP